MLTVLSWFWLQPGAKSPYTAAHVNLWADQVRRHLSLPHRLACVTDAPEGIDPRVEIIAPPRTYEDARIPTWEAHRPQCLRRLAMFAPDAGAIFGERFVCMDLDCVVAGPLDPLFEGEADFRMFRGTAPGRPYNGSMMLLKAGARPQVVEEFTLAGAEQAGRLFVGSDQAWISHVLGPDEATWGPEHGVEWWSGRRPVAETRLMFFPGTPKPWDVVLTGGDPWVERHYRREPRAGRCLALGYGRDVWAQASAAMDGGAFEAVIASPEAAAHWPRPVDLVVHSDAAAWRAARMLGHAEVTFCGASEEAA